MAAPSSPRVLPQRIWLVGSMGAGKTAVGTALAALLGWPLIDNDRELEELAGRELVAVAADGADVLHRLESEQLRMAATRPGPFVAGVAASVGDRSEDVTLLRESGVAVYLRATPRTLARRIGTGADRPWLGDAPEAWLADQLGRREAGYLASASLVVDVDARTPDDVALVVLGWLRGPEGPGVTWESDGPVG